MQLLDAVRNTWYQEDCDLDESFDYDDDFFEGQLEVWICTPGAESWILAARPISDPTAYLVLLQVQSVASYDPDYTDLQRMLNTFDVSQYNLP
jgi:hypothetical protein